MKLSAIIITFNEAHNIRACLESLAFADEIVVVDSGSSDGTVDIAESLGARVFRTEDWPGFGPQKNRALDRATGDWVLSIDADERISAESAAEIRAAIANGDERPCHLPRLTQFCGQWIQHCGWTPDYVLRLFKRGTARFSDDLVHERVVTQGPGEPRRLRYPMLHYSYPTPASYLDKVKRYSQAWAEQQFVRGKKTTVTRAAVSAAFAFIKSYVLRLGFLDGAMGFVVCTLQAEGAFHKYFALYCMHKRMTSHDHKA